MRRFLFLIAFVDGSPSTWGTSEVEKQSDLLKVFQSDTFEDIDETLFGAYVIEVAESLLTNTLEIATKYGYAEAFHDGFTVKDTVSICQEIDENFKLPNNSHHYSVLRVF